MLCGFDENGEPCTDNMDAINLLSEIKASQEHKIQIKLPDDDDPSNPDPIEYNLVISVLLISLDWLANGAFGPFAESVSATRPCFKCKWTDRCGCAWIARSDGRNGTIAHSAQCRRKVRRTHSDTTGPARTPRPCALGITRVVVASCCHASCRSEHARAPPATPPASTCRRLRVAATYRRLHVAATCTCCRDMLPRRVAAHVAATPSAPLTRL